MCKLFDEWKNEIEEYCKANTLSFEKALKAAKSWGKSDIALQYVDKEKTRTVILYLNKPSIPKNI